MSVDMREYFGILPEEKLPEFLDYSLGVEEGFIDAAELLDSGTPDDTKSVIRVRLRVAPKLDGFPYFLGYALGHEMLTIYRTAGECRK